MSDAWTDDRDFSEPRLLVAGDTERLVPLVSELFSPVPVVSAPDYLAAIAEIPRAPTQGVILGIDPACRRTVSAVGAIKQVAGETRVVACCEPSYEPLTRKLLSAGLDDYVIFPPSGADLERALQIPVSHTRREWMQTIRAPEPTFDELTHLTSLLPHVMTGDRALLREMAAVVAAGLRAESAMVVVDGSTGSVGSQPRGLIDRAVLVQELHREGRPVGQIRVGPSQLGAYHADDTARLRVYAGLFGKLLELVSRSRQWQQWAFQDDLTGLPNRRRLMAFLDEILDRAAREQFPVTVLLFDIDDFKSFNDSFGHETGDEIIRETGQLFRRCSRRHDLVARFGGDEFVVVFWDPEGRRSAGSQHPSEVIGVLNRFRRELSTHQFARLGPRSSGSLTCSGGLARFPWQARTPAELLARADQALLEAKRAGKDRFWLIGSGDVCTE